MTDTCRTRASISEGPTDGSVTDFLWERLRASFPKKCQGQPGVKGNVVFMGVWSSTSDGELVMLVRPSDDSASKAPKSKKRKRQDAKQMAELELLGTLSSSGDEDSPSVKKLKLENKHLRHLNYKLQEALCAKVLAKGFYGSEEDQVLVGGHDHRIVMAPEVVQPAAQLPAPALQPARGLPASQPHALPPSVRRVVEVPTIGMLAALPAAGPNAAGPRAAGPPAAGPRAAGPPAAGPLLLAPLLLAPLLLAPLLLAPLLLAPLPLAPLLLAPVLLVPVLLAPLLLAPVPMSCLLQTLLLSSWPLLTLPLLSCLLPMQLHGQLSLVPWPTHFL
ncbi:BEN domain-containing protein 5 isoform X2 [Ixodes scapularis]